MKQVNDEVVVDCATPLVQVVAYLEQLVGALKAGAVHVRHGDREVVLGPRDVLDFSLHAKARNKRHRLSLELTWRRKTHAADAALELSFAGPQLAPIPLASERLDAGVPESATIPDPQGA